MEDHTSDGTNFVFILSRQGKNKSQGDFDLLIAVRIFKLYKDYFDVPYSLSNLDMVDRHDVVAGTMYSLVT